MIRTREIGLSCLWTFSEASRRLVRLFLVCLFIFLSHTNSVIGFVLLSVCVIDDDSSGIVHALAWPGWLYEVDALAVVRDS